MGVVTATGPEDALALLAPLSDLAGDCWGEEIVTKLVHSNNSTNACAAPRSSCSYRTAIGCTRHPYTKHNSYSLSARTEDGEKPPQLLMHPTIRETAKSGSCPFTVIRIHNQGSKKDQRRATAGRRRRLLCVWGL